MGANGVEHCNSSQLSYSSKTGSGCADIYLLPLAPNWQFANILEVFSFREALLLQIGCFLYII